MHSKKIRCVTNIEVEEGIYMDLQLRNLIHCSRVTPIGEPGKSIPTLLSF